MNDIKDDNKILCLIPARYDSTRLKGKPLLKINDVSIIQRVYQNALECNIDKAIVLTDNNQIHNEISAINGESRIVKEECYNGTDRIIKYLKKQDNQDFNIILNIQGDEPFINPNHVNLCIDNFIKRRKEDPKTVCSTICFKTRNKDEIMSKSRGKAVLDKDNNIMYCSRNVIPSNKSNIIVSDRDYYIHVGIFVFDKDYLLEHFGKENTDLQMTEDIEWLKIIEQGFKINAIIVDDCERGVDTQEDYDYLKNKYEK